MVPSANVRNLQSVFPKKVFCEDMEKKIDYKTDFYLVYFWGLLGYNLYISFFGIIGNVAAMGSCDGNKKQRDSSTMNNPARMYEKLNFCCTRD